jgi:protein-disulfide isomerase
VLDRDQAEAAKAGVDGTPTFFVNGAPLVGAQPLEAFTAAIDKALAATSAR